MAIFEQLAGAPDAGGRMVLICKKCPAPAQDAKTTKILKVCSKCGAPLGEWSTEAERDAELREFEERFRRAGSPAPVMKRYRARITSGEEKGRYVGMVFGGGFVSNPEVLKNPPKNVPGYGLWVQERGATEFFEGNTARVQAELKALGYDTELVEVQ